MGLNQHSTWTAATNGVGQIVVAVHVHPLVGADDAALAGVVALLVVGRDDQPGRDDADQGGTLEAEPGAAQETQLGPGHQGCRRQKARQPQDEKDIGAARGGQQDGERVGQLGPRHPADHARAGRQQGGRRRQQRGQPQAVGDLGSKERACRSPQGEHQQHAGGGGEVGAQQGFDQFSHAARLRP
jgi:hypothetical protein